MGHFRKSAKILLVAGLLVGSAGCATVRSDVVARADRDEGTASTGITYFLPRQLMNVQVARSPKTIADKAKALATAQANLETARTNVTTARAEVVAALAALGSNENASANGEFQTNLAEARARVRLLEAEVDRRQTAVTTATTAYQDAVNAGIAADERQANVTVAFSLLEPSADPRFAFSMQPEHSAFRDQESTFVVGSNGLLASADIIATDRTADVLVELATFAGAAFALGPAATAGGPPDPDADAPCANLPNNFNRIIDITVPGDVLDLNQTLQCYGVWLDVSDQNWSRSYNSGDASYAGDVNQREGIFYRTPVDVVVQLRKNSQNTDSPADWPVVETHAFSLPQAGPIGMVRQDASAFARTTYDLDFDNGILTNYGANRPGEAMEVARLPMRLVNGLFGGISQIISLRTGRAEEELALVNALAALDRSGITNQQERNAALLALMQSEGSLATGEVEQQRALNAALLALMQSEGGLATGEVEQQRAINAAMLALLQSEAGLTTGAITLDQQRNAALLLLLQSQAQLERQGVVSGTAMLEALNAQLAAQSQLSTGTITGASQLQAAQFQALIEQAQRAQTERCLLEQAQVGGDITVCLD